MCPQCRIYYPSTAALKPHQWDAACVYDSNDDERDSGSETEVIEEEARTNEDTAPVVNIFELLQNPALSWMEITTMRINSLTKTLDRAKI